MRSERRKRVIKMRRIPLRCSGGLVTSLIVALVAGIGYLLAIGFRSLFKDGAENKIKGIAIIGGVFFVCVIAQISGR